MTYAEIKALGAEIVLGGFTAIPDDGWKEASIAHLQRVKDETSSDREFARTADDHDRANRWHTGVSAAMARAEKGERVFSVRWDDELAFAATKNHG